MGDWYWGTGAGWLSFVLMLVFIAIIIVGVVLVIRSLSDGGRDRSRYEEGRPPPPRGSSALAILEERYARGEIDRQEFLDRKRDLTS